MKHIGISSCDVHRHTLSELFEIVKVGLTFSGFIMIYLFKEEAEIYENCLANNNKD
jgi:hypothetical protein